MVQHESPASTWQPLLPRVAHAAHYDSNPRVRAAAMHALTVAAAVCGMDVMQV